MFLIQLLREHLSLLAREFISQFFFPQGKLWKRNSALKKNITVEINVNAKKHNIYIYISVFHILMLKNDCTTLIDIIDFIIYIIIYLSDQLDL